MRTALVAVVLVGCVGPDRDGDGWSESLDCDDASASVHPTALEVCDGVDDDCDGLVDLGAIDAPVWYPDADGDGAGDPAGKVFACQPPPTGVRTGDDCDDDNLAVHPGAIEYCNGRDDDCDGAVDEDATSQRPWFPDNDLDGHGNPLLPDFSCVPAPNAVTLPDDCDDTDPLVHPGAPEDCDGVDQDCDGIADDDPVDGYAYHPDTDGDGFGWGGITVQACGPAAGWAEDATDCDDFDALAFPGAPERCNGRDDDCDGIVDGPDPVDPVPFYVDGDGDGFGAGAGTPRCAAEPGEVDLPGDCDDAVATTNPFAPEVCGNLIDDDCNGLVDECP